MRDASSSVSVLKEKNEFKSFRKILNNSGLEIISANDLSDAAKKIVEAIK